MSSKGTIRGYDPKKVYTDSNILIREAAEAFAVENSGNDSTEMRIDYLYSTETEGFIDDEVHEWRKVTKAVVPELIKRNLPLTIEELDKVAKEPRFNRLYNS